MRRNCADVNVSEKMVRLARVCLIAIFLLLPVVAILEARGDDPQTTGNASASREDATPAIAVRGFAFHGTPARSPWPYPVVGELPLLARLRAPLPLEAGTLLVLFVNRVEDAPGDLQAPDICSFSVNAVFVNDNRSFIRLTNTSPLAAMFMALLTRNILGVEQAGEEFSFELIECGTDGLKQVSLVFDFRPPL